MASPYTHCKLATVRDSAPDFGQHEVQEVRFATSELEAQDTGLALKRIKPNTRVSLGHRHERAEEVYVVLSGSGRVKLDNQIIDLQQLDALRVAPSVTRAFEAGPHGLELLAFGPRHDNDGELLTDWWTN